MEFIINSCDPGLSYMVYPGAVHTRFEHSLGVYWLAGKAIDVIKKYQVNIVLMLPYPDMFIS